MSETIIREWHALWYAAAAGAAYAWAYDQLRLLRRLLRHNSFWVNLEDILYWVCCFAASFILLYYGNHGVIRSFAVLGAALGMFAYCATIGRVYVRLMSFLIAGLLRPLSALCRFWKNRLTTIANHFKIKVDKLCVKGESVRARRSAKAPKQKKTGIPAQKK